MGFAVVAFVNVILCVVYAIAGWIPGFGNGLLPSNPARAFVAVGVRVSNVNYKFLLTTIIITVLS